MNTEHEQQETNRGDTRAAREIFGHIGRNLGRRPALEDLMGIYSDYYRKILMFIEQGAFDYVAAEAMGVTAITWNRWLRQGREDYEGEHPESLYARFYRDVLSAQSRGRLMAELEVKRDDVKFYLRNGPGKTKPGRPGWTETVALSGDEELPLERENTRDEPSVSDLAAALALVEQLGFATPTKDLGGMLEHYSALEGQVIDAKSSDPPSQKNGTGDDSSAAENEAPALAHMEQLDQEELKEELEEEEAEKRGHNPDRGTPWQDIDYNQLPDEYR